MERLSRKTASAGKYPDKVIQFGEGNFLRAFVDWIIWKMDKIGRVPRQNNIRRGIPCISAQRKRRSLISDRWTGTRFRRTVHLFRHMGISSGTWLLEQKNRHDLRREDISNDASSRSTVRFRPHNSYWG